LCAEEIPAGSDVKLDYCRHAMAYRAQENNREYDQSHWPLDPENVARINTVWGMQNWHHDLK
jgi:hypothetical protein